MSQMRIGFDAKKAMRNHTGIGNYSRRCICAVEQQGIQACLFYSNIPVLGELWRNFLQWWSIRRSHIDIYHGLSNELPFGIRWSGTKCVVTIHDLIFLRIPQTYGRLDRLILRLKTRYACHVADRIVAVSDMTRRDLISFYHIDPSRIEVIYQSIDDCYRQLLPEANLTDVRARYHLPETFILCVGTIQERKNQHTLVRALPYLPEHVHLVMVGKAEDYVQVVMQTAHELNVVERVHIYNNVPSCDLPAIYQKATIFTCLSRFEGFCIPIGEALASGIPVIAATGSCLEEAGGPDSIYLEPDDAEGLAHAVDELLTYPEKARNMATAGRIYSERFTDTELSAQLSKLYNELVHKPLDV